jgi:hypothetical protein
MLTIDPKWYPKWFGREVSEETAHRVFTVLDDQLKRRFGSTLQMTPGRTGVLAWRRLQEQRSGAVGGLWQPLPPDLQTIIRETTGQGRFECCPVASEIPAIYCLDMTLAYAAGAIALDSAREWRHEQRPADGWQDWTHDVSGGKWGNLVFGWLAHAPAWYKVRFAIPDDWRHVGLLPVWQDGTHVYTGERIRGWLWPDGPTRYTEGWATWAGYQEVKLAIEQGWEVEILERVYAVKDGGSYPKPLRLWAEKLVEMRGADWHGTGEHGLLFQAAVRNVLLHAIGHCARNPRTVTRTAAEGEFIPDHERARATIRPTEEGWEYDDYAVSKGDEPYQHPEWAALIWSDCRARLLRQAVRQEGCDPATVGALAVPREQIVGMAQDALYLTHDPQWPATGKPGGFRVKGYVAGPLPAPRTMGDIYAAFGEAK